MSAFTIGRPSAMGRKRQFTGSESRHWPVSLRNLALRRLMKGRFRDQSGRRRGDALNDWRALDFIGAGEKSRTPDLRITNALLYQLSYTGENENYSKA